MLRESCSSPAPLFYRREKMSLREGKRLGPLTSLSRTFPVHPPPLKCNTSESSDLLGNKKQFFSRHSLLKKSLFIVDFWGVQETLPFVRDLPPQVGPIGYVCIRWGHSPGLRCLDQGKHSDQTGKSHSPLYNLDVGYQVLVGLCGPWIGKWDEAAMSVFN